VASSTAGHSSRAWTRDGFGRVVRCEGRGRRRRRSRRAGRR